MGLRDALANVAPTRAGAVSRLAQRIIVAKGFDEQNAVLRKAVSYRLVHCLRLAHRAGKLADAGKVKNARIWALPMKPHVHD